MVEFQAIHAFICLRRPNLGDAFVDWCTARSEIDGFTANGVHCDASSRHDFDSKTLAVLS
jgi:hypothetical protein